MKSAVLVLGFLMLVSAMLGGLESGATGNFVSPTKQRALNNLKEFSSIDRQIQEKDFVISTDEMLNYQDNLIVFSDEELEFVLDFSFLDDSAFTKIQDYIDYYGLKAFLEVSDEVFETELVPSGFLKYSCSFKISETGPANLGYKTKTWSKEKEVVIASEDALTQAIGFDDLGL